MKQGKTRYAEINKAYTFAGTRTHSLEDNICLMADDIKDGYKIIDWEIETNNTILALYQGPKTTITLRKVVIYNESEVD